MSGCVTNAATLSFPQPSDRLLASMPFRTATSDDPYRFMYSITALATDSTDSHSFIQDICGQRRTI
jgi:hypothetical protein